MLSVASITGAVEGPAKSGSTRGERKNRGGAIGGSSHELDRRRVAVLVATVLLIGAGLFVAAPDIAAADDDHEDEYVVVRFADDHIVTESVADEIPPEPYVSVDGSDGDDRLIVDDGMVVDANSGEQIVAGSEDNRVQTISGDPNLVVSTDGYVNDTLVVNDDGLIETSEEGITATVGDEDGDEIIFEEANEAYFNVSILDDEIDDVGAGETLTIPVEITNDGYGTDEEDVLLEILDGSGNVLGSVDEELSLDRGETTTLEFEYETEQDDREAEMAEVTADTKFSATSSGIDSADITIHSAETLVTITDADDIAPAAGDELEITAEVERFGNDPEGEQDVLVEFRVDGTHVSTEAVTLGPGDSSTETFTYQTSEDDAPGVTATLTSQDGGDTATADVDVIGQASYNESVSAEIIDRNYPDEGDDLVITGEVGYTGVVPDSPQEHRIQLFVDGEVADERTIELDGDEWVESEFTYETQQGDAPRVDVELRSPGTGDTARPLVAGSGFAVDIQGIVEPVNVTDDLITTAAIENTGDIDGEQDVRVRIDRGVDDPGTTDHHVRDNRTISLEAGERTIERFSFRTRDADVPKIEVAVISDDDEDVTNATVRSRNARFDVPELSADRDGASDSEIELSAAINNTGLEPDEQYVEFVLDDDVVHIDRVHLEPWEERVITTTVEAPEDDSSFSVVTDNVSETVTAAGVDDPDDGDEPSDEPSTDDSDTNGESADGEPTDDDVGDEDEGGVPWYLFVLGVLGVVSSVLALIAYRNDPDAFPPDAASVKERASATVADIRRELIAIGIAARNGDTAAVMAALKGLVGLGPGTLIVQNELPRRTTVRVRCQTAHDTVLLQDLELDPDERRALGSLPNVSQFKVGAGVEDITAHEEVFQEISGDIGVVLRADGILIANLG
ncbi:hypothetical protein EA462_16635 [Natrarchaeobius halalkaliphilus]|uniref:CARDB domain-containing protein n=1 Tax=Natrarchaeobius halalkaliphilus TaxID=1679091 RepID=A0A3N6NUC6_9EURY|nr:hypothetical protein [Natrarchaeobius halalkaliphilus]RQG86760.1 hypothetical protein EA462_16635 [Natrarchaeobius halalkaliphilus]